MYCSAVLPGSRVAAAIGYARQRRAGLDFARHQRVTGRARRIRAAGLLHFLRKELLAVGRIAGRQLNGEIRTDTLEGRLDPAGGCLGSASPSQS